MQRAHCTMYFKWSSA